MKECERRGLVKIVTTGTVNEVFLPGEDTSKSAFGEPGSADSEQKKKKKSKKEKQGTNGDVDPYDLLVEAVHEARRRDNLCTMATLKVIMKDISAGFDESNYTDDQGKSFSKFKDFVETAQDKGLVQILTTGTVHEVFLPNEDPQKLSRFASNGDN